MKLKSEHIRVAGIMIAVMILLFAGYLYVSKKDHPPPPPRYAPGQPDIMLKGTVETYGSNPDKDIDKLLLKTDAGEQWLHFPPHAARGVLSVAQLNDKVEIAANDDKRKSPPGDNPQCELASITNTKTGTTIAIHHIPPPAPVEGKQTEITGTILDYVVDNRGNRRSIIIGRKLIALPPPAREALLPLLVKNKNITVKGWERSADAGFVNTDSLTVIRPYAVVIDGTEYSIR